jgi:hypothetical protein
MRPSPKYKISNLINYTHPHICIKIIYNIIICKVLCLYYHVSTMHRMIGVYLDDL